MKTTAFPADSALRHIARPHVEAELYRGKGTGLVVNAHWSDTSGPDSWGYAYTLKLVTSPGMLFPRLPDGRDLDAVLATGPTLEARTQWSEGPVRQCRHVADESAIASTLAAMRGFLATLPLDQATGS